MALSLTCATREEKRPRHTSNYITALTTSFTVGCCTHLSLPAFFYLFNMVVTPENDQNSEARSSFKY